MEYAEISQKIASIKTDLDKMLSQKDLEPCISSCLESILAHVNLLYIELGLDAR